MCFSSSKYPCSVGYFEFLLVDKINILDCYCFGLDIIHQKRDNDTKNAMYI